MGKSCLARRLVLWGFLGILFLGVSIQGIIAKEEIPSAVSQVTKTDKKQVQKRLKEKISLSTHYPEFEYQIDYYGTKRLPEPVEREILSKLEDTPEYLSFIGSFVIASTRVEKKWGSFAISIVENEEMTLADADTVYGMYADTPDGLFVVFDWEYKSKQNKLKRILDVIPLDNEYGLMMEVRVLDFPSLYSRDQLPKQSSSAIYDEAGTALLSTATATEAMTLTVNSNRGWLLPFTGASEWSVNLYKKWHENNSLDFGTVGEQFASAPIDSKITWRCLANGTTSHYHLRLSSLTGGQVYRILHVSGNDFPVGKVYQTGDIIAPLARDTPNDTTCAHSSGPHIHFQFPSVPYTLDGYLFNGRSADLSSYDFQHLQSTQGLDIYKHPRVIGQGKNGDPMFVGFGNNQALIAFPATSSGFASKASINNFAYNNGDWRVNLNPRAVGDIDGNGVADIVGFGDPGVYVSFGYKFLGLYQFSTPKLVLSDFGYDQGWQVSKHLRVVADVNDDGRDDIIGFGNAGVYVAYSSGGGFLSPRQLLKDFAYNAGGWRVNMHPRTVADVNDDGKADIVGFGNSGVLVAYSNGAGFDSASFKLGTFGYDAGGWRVDKNPRTAADVNGDGKADIIGFGNSGVYVAFSTGSGFGTASLKLSAFGYDAGGWRVDKHPRTVVDIDKDGKADIVGFGNSGVLVAKSTGNGFASPSLVYGNYGYDAGGWR